MQKKIFSLFYITVSVVMAAGISVLMLKEHSIRVINDGTTKLESAIERVFPLKSGMRELYGSVNRLISPNEIVNARDVIVKDGDGFLEPISYSDYDTGEAARNITELADVCNNAGAEFVYVSYPSKTNAQTTAARYGIETNGEEMRHGFLDALQKNGIKVLDVRCLLEGDGYTPKDVFYKTDHHWKTFAGLYAAKEITEYLNDSFAYGLDTGLLDEEKFSFTTYEDLWLGETGCSVSKTWTGALDDFTEIKPLYETSFSVGKYGNDEKENGDFSILIDRSGYEGKNDLYNYSAHYSYTKGANSLTHTHNCKNVNGEKILIIKDSFSIVVIPFLALPITDIVAWDMRDNPDGLYDFIRQNDFDAVLLAYTDFWRADMYDFR